MNPYTNAFESIFTLYTFTKIILLFPKDTQMKSFPSKTSQGRYKIWAYMAWKVIILMTQLDIHYKQIYMTKKSPKEKTSIKSQLKGINAQHIHKKRTVKNLLEWMREVFLEKANLNQIEKIINFLQNRIKIKCKKEGMESSLWETAKWLLYLTGRLGKTRWMKVLWN